MLFKPLEGGLEAEEDAGGELLSGVWSSLRVLVVVEEDEVVEEEGGRERLAGGSGGGVAPFVTPFVVPSLSFSCLIPSSTSFLNVPLFLL